ncbi:ABC transporter ATP-binding protein [Aerococcus sanguinicola]|uniref:ABC transporter ATP-binding protein n=1 Tax=Aerococcus sanguinicola TaxID=119206 RepID=A0A2I1MQB8_9LACT|nr:MULTISPECIES: ATP-binding cassette domain-containing protein [Aerococcus]OFT93377.1 ABC transporter ATP-binding protein [Aerococcus sp. HMSC23C02]PKZ22338.1 ABC transporter ATP-binding protein [Aerococcus sanguinicola]
MSLIEVHNITKDYGEGRGNFDISFSVEEGQVFGFVGVNGAGKTTLIRQMMGFLESDNGDIKINSLDSWKDSAKIKKLVGYVPGEIAFPDSPTGNDFFKKQAELLELKDMSFAKEIIATFQLDPSANLKRMSKGMKQKTAIVAAFMADPDILILDEPTTGLDPLMRKDFIELINREKKRGKTIFMSSHMFEEVENTCDLVAFIKDGKIVDIKDTKSIRHNENKKYKVEFESFEEYKRYTENEQFHFSELRDKQNQVIVNIHDTEINAFLESLKDYELKFMTEIKYSLEQYFKELY